MRGQLIEGKGNERNTRGQWMKHKDETQGLNAWGHEGAIDGTHRGNEGVTRGQ